MSSPKYFILTDLFTTFWRVVYREVETTDPTTGHPLTFMQKALPEIYLTEQEAQAAADRLNAHEGHEKKP